MSSARRQSSSSRSSPTSPSSPTSFPPSIAAPPATPERSVDGAGLGRVLPRRHDEDLAGIDQVGVADVAAIGLVDQGVAHTFAVHPAGDAPQDAAGLPPPHLPRRPTRHPGLLERDTEGPRVGT